MLTQTLALFIDSYRELSARKIFWITLGLSALIVLLIAAVGFSDEGNMTLLWFDTSLPLADMGIEKDVFYKMVFINLGFRFWLAWGATILALASTAGIFPDFISGGAIDLALSKPIGRVRLLLTKYAASLLFVALQVAVFSLCAFLVIGIRGGAWEPAVFYAVPLVTLFYSYLYSVCALCGILTRSAITSLIVTGVFWFVVFVVGSTENVLLGFRTEREVRVHSYETSIAALERQAEGAGDAQDADGGGLTRIKEFNDARVAGIRLERAQANLEEAREQAQAFVRYHRIAFAAKTLLPKTGETLDMLEHRLVSMSDVAGLLGEDGSPPPPSTLTDDGELSPQQLDAQRSLSALEMESRLRSRSPWWILGASLAFEGAVLGFAAWRFNRRDF